jgi:hypothetical protein
VIEFVAWRVTLLLICGSLRVGIDQRGHVANGLRSLLPSEVDADIYDGMGRLLISILTTIRIRSPTP